MAKSTKTDTETGKSRRIAREILKVVAEGAVVGVLSAVIQHFIFKV